MMTTTLGIATANDTVYRCIVAAGDESMPRRKALQNHDLMVVRKSQRIES